MIDIISKSRINNIPLDISREDLLKLDYSVEQFRIGFSQNNQFVRSISVIATDAFRIDGELVKLSQMTEWYRKENPLVDGNSYIFPNKNLAIWDSNGMFEITLYSNKEKDLYEYVTLSDIEKINEAVSLQREKIIAPDGAANYMLPVLKEMDEETFELFVRYQMSVAERMDLMGASAHTVDILRVS